MAFGFLEWRWPTLERQARVVDQEADERPDAHVAPGRFILQGRVLQGRDPAAERVDEIAHRPYC